MAGKTDTITAYAYDTDTGIRSLSGSSGVQFNNGAIVETYTVTYDANGGDGTPAAATFTGTALDLPSAGAKAGKVQRGWSASGSAPAVADPYTPTANVTLKAIWVDAATLVYDANGGTGAAPTDAGSRGAGDVVSSLAAGTGLSKTGYTFDGWSSSSGASNSGNKVTSVTLTAGTNTVYAIWKANELSMATISPVSGTYGEAITEVTLPEATNGTGTYTYSTSGTLPAGLSINTTTRKLTGTPTEANTTGVTITWTATDDNSAKTTFRTFTVTIAKANQTTPTLSATAEDNGGDGKITITNLSSYTNGEAFEITGPNDDNFANATLNAGAIENLTAGSYKVRVKADDNHNASAAATATVGAAAGKVQVIYNKNADDATGTVAADTVNENTTGHTLKTATYTRPGYTQNGWAETSDGTAPVTTVNTNTANKNVYAIWVAKDVTLTDATLTFGSDPEVGTQSTSTYDLMDAVGAGSKGDGVTTGFTFALADNNATNGVVIAGSTVKFTPANMIDKTIKIKVTDPNGTTDTADFTVTTITGKELTVKAKDVTVKSGTTLKGSDFLQLEDGSTLLTGDTLPALFTGAPDAVTGVTITFYEPDPDNEGQWKAVGAVPTEVGTYKFTLGVTADNDFANKYDLQTTTAGTFNTADGTGDDGTLTIQKKSPVVVGGSTTKEDESEHTPYMIGRTTTSFAPKGNLLRGEAATIMSRLTEGFDADKSYTGADFTDENKAADHWSYSFVSFAESHKILTGYPDGSFQPDRAITRAEFAAMVARFIGKAPAGTSKFTDVGGHWGEGYIAVLEKAGIVDGDGDGTFRPDDNITRAEACTIMNRVLNRVPLDKLDLAANDYVNPFTDLKAADWWYANCLEASLLHRVIHFHEVKK